MHSENERAGRETLSQTRWKTRPDFRCRSLTYIQMFEFTHTNAHTYTPHTHYTHVQRQIIVVTIIFSWPVACLFILLTVFEEHRFVSVGEIYQFVFLIPLYLSVGGDLAWTPLGEGGEKAWSQQHRLWGLARNKSQFIYWGDGQASYNLSRGPIGSGNQRCCIVLPSLDVSVPAVSGCSGRPKVGSGRNYLLWRAGLGRATAVWVDWPTVSPTHKYFPSL